MRVAIVGAGAMGTLLGHAFVRAGVEVTLLDLPARVARIKAAGKLVVVSPDGRESTASPVTATADYGAAGTFDVVFLATKAQDLPAVARNVVQLAHADTCFVTIQNGIPWWYLHGLDLPDEDARIQCLDPDGLLEQHIDPAYVVGCVAYPAAVLEADGRAVHVEGVRFPVGELDGSVKPRTERLSGLFEAAGFKSRIIDDIRSEIWLKAWGAISINPISALTRSTMVDICTDEETRRLVATMMTEVQDVARAYGAHFRHTIEKRIEGARAVGAHKTSMLQDVENGRALELDALMLAALELADRAGKPMPTVRAIYACTRLLDATLQEDTPAIARPDAVEH